MAWRYFFAHRLTGSLGMLILVVICCWLAHTPDSADDLLLTALPVGRLSRRHTIEHASGRLSFEPISPAGVVEVRISGVLSNQSLRVLYPELFRHVRGARALVIRLDSALSLICQQGAASAVPDADHDTMPAAIVVQPEQFDLVAANSARLAALGFRRAVFRLAQLEPARRWAQRHAGICV